MQPSTTYGALGNDIPDEEAHHLTIEGQVNDNEIDAQQAGYATFGKGVLLSIALLGVSFAAVSVSNIGSSASKTTKLDSNVERIVFATLSDYDKEALFRTYVDDYGKKYKTEEYQSKLNAFRAFLDECDARNMAESAAGGSAVHGITKFADLTPTEFLTYLGYVKTSEDTDYESYVATNSSSNSTIPTAVDWTGIYTTDVKDQGYCGSCWAFSATEQLESDAIRELGWSREDTLAPQQIVSCDNYDDGCDGGDTEIAYVYIKKAGGLDTEEDYPYTSYYGMSKSCSVSSDFGVTLTGFVTLRGDDSDEVEDKMIDYVLTTGPLSVCLDASTWSSYQSGVVSVCPTDVDHCVQVVGVDTEEGYWKVRNSWGTDWGEDGYIYLSLGSNTCGITYDPTYVRPALV